MSNSIPTKFFAVLAALLILQGCERERPRQVESTVSTPVSGTLKSQHETFERHGSNCPDRDECSSVSVTREVFEQQPALNEAIREQLLARLQGNEQDQETSDSLDEIADQFLTEAAEVERISSAHWQLSGAAERVARRGDVLTVEIKTYRYTGGAHGIPSVEWLNWDLATGERVSLQQVIRTGKQGDFWELAEAAHQRWLDQQSGIDTQYREAWPFQRSEDFRFNDDGIVLRYGVYELGPYAIGPVQLTIPWQDLRDVIRDRYLP